MNTPDNIKNPPHTNPTNNPNASPKANAKGHKVCTQCKRPIGLFADPNFSRHLYGPPFADMGLREELENLDKQARRILARRLEVLETIARWEGKPRLKS